MGSETFGSVWRMLRRDTALALVVAATLALAIGAVVSTYTVVDGVLLRPLPIEDAGRVVNIVHTRRDRGGHYGVPYHSYLAWRDQNESFSALAAARERDFKLELHAGDPPDRVSGTEVSPEFWQALGVSPVLGRPLEASDAAPRAAPVVVISDSLWRSRFDADHDVLGEQVSLDGTPYTIVGVMPPAREDLWLEWRSLWTPLVIDEAAAREQIVRGFSVLGRLAPGATLERARADLDTVASRLEEEYPQYNQGWTAEIHPIRWWIDGQVRPQLLLLLVAVSLVLLIACANVGNLLLSSATSRGRELAVRLALGASRGRLVRQLLTEAMSLALIGGLGGLLLARLATRVLRSTAGARLPRVEEITIDPRVALVCLGVSLVAGIACAVVPSFRLSRGDSISLVAGGHSMTDAQGTRRWRAALVAFQVALALAVSVGALLLARSIRELQQVDPGWNTERLLTARLELPDDSHPEKQARIESFRDLTDRVAALPGVEHAALCGTRLPLLSGQGTFELFVEGQPRTDTPEIIVTAGFVSPDYFSAMGVPLIEGEAFATDATWENTQAVVVSEGFAREFFPSEDFPNGVVGRYVEWRSGDRGTIVGVAGDVRQIQLERDPTRLVYLAWGPAPRSQILVARTDSDPAELVAPIRDLVKRWAPGTSVTDVQTGDDIVRDSYADRSFAALLFAVFGALALSLGALGVYAVVTHSTALRRREMAIRLACGARRGQVVAQIVRESLRPVWLGLLIGCAGALALGRLLKSQLFGISQLDPTSFALAGLLLLTCAALASLLPAREAAEIDPATSLRSE